MPDISRDRGIEDKFAEFYRTYAWDRLSHFVQGYPRDQRRFELDYRELERFDPDLADDFVSEPDIVREHARRALTVVDLPVEHEFTDARVVLGNVPGYLQQHAGRTGQQAAGEIRGIRGQVTRKSQRTQRHIETAFECTRCGTITYQPQHHIRWREPGECDGCERQGPFEVNFQASEMVDKQHLEVQVAPDAGGTISTDTVEILAEDDLVNTVSTGDRVVVPSVVHFRQTRSGQQKENSFEVWGEADSIDALDGQLDDFDVEAHREAFETVANGPDPVGDVVDSMAPSLHGYDDIKRAIAFQLFGGVNKELSDGSTYRGDPHILLVGDPGLGKSMILSYVADLVPRSVYTTGQGSSAAGLTASAVKSDFGGEGWTLKAGALVEASGGVCAIDELDEMDETERGALLEGMADGHISVSKAGINATVTAETRVLAAANPKYGRFDRYEAIAQQIDLDPAIVSRFDLIFTMLDEVDAEQDADVADHVLTRQRQAQREVNGKQPTAAQQADTEPTLSKEEMRAYIAYAREHHQPELTDAAKERLREGYLSIRTAAEDDEDADAPIPITARKLEALVRFAEASARIRLADEATVADAEYAIDLVHQTLADVGLDPETGEFDADRTEAGTTNSQRQRYRTVLDIVEELEAEYEFGAPHKEIIATAKDEGMDGDTADHIIEKLKREEGEIYVTTQREQPHYRRT